ncbi:MAG: class I SAM-dependent methyltransferase [Cognatishimia sp.]
MTAVLTATKRASVGDGIDIRIFENLQRSFPGLSEGLSDVVELRDKYSLELAIRQALIREMAPQLHQCSILELGSGLSALARKIARAECKIVEHDTDTVIELRRRCLDFDMGSALLSQVSYVSGEIQSTELWREISEELAGCPYPRVVLCEGLMRYLSMEAKKDVARNIWSLLGASGVWITCDVTLSEMLDEEEAEVDISDQELAKSVTSDQRTNAFRNRNDCIEFFRNLEFDVEFHSATHYLDAIAKTLGDKFEAAALEGPAKFVNVLKMKRTR